MSICGRLFPSSCSERSWWCPLSQLPWRRHGPCSDHWGTRCMEGWVLHTNILTFTLFFESLLFPLFFSFLCHLLLINYGNKNRIIYCEKEKSKIFLLSSFLSQLCLSVPIKTTLWVTLSKFLVLGTVWGRIWLWKKREKCKWI